MFCFVHAADLHLDTPFEGIGHAAPEVAEMLRDASLRAWDRLVRLAMDQDAAFVALAGDIYDGPERGVRAQLHFLEGLKKLSSAGIQVFIAHGNHDPLDGWSAISEWPRGVTVFGSENVTAVPVERDGRLLAMVHGVSYARPETTENLATWFQRGREKVLHVGVLHCNVGNNSAHQRYAPCTVRDLVASGMDYWALGHIHQRQYIQEGDPWIVYPGNTQGRSLKESETGPKGAVVVRAEGTGIVHVEFFPLDEVRFGSVHVDISHVDSLPELIGVLISEARRLTAGQDLRALVLKAELAGRGHMHRKLTRRGAVREVLEELREQSREMSPLVWWDSLTVSTAAEIDREAVRSRGDFQADLVCLVDRLLSNPEALARFFETHATSLDDSLPILTRFLDPPDGDQMRELLVQAETLALDMLQEGDQE
ncbi:MAG TPA: DNA repair exonuclease [Firmicutes bacterium]|nr:DNA repair exonuclease [Bacillota bacterium]